MGMHELVQATRKEVNRLQEEVARLHAENRALTVFRAEFAHRNAELWERAELDKARLDWILDNIRQTDLMLMLPKYTGDRGQLYAAIDAARKGEQCLKNANTD